MSDIIHTLYVTDSTYDNPGINYNYSKYYGVVIY